MLRDSVSLGRPVVPTTTARVPATVSLALPRVMTELAPVAAAPVGAVVVELETVVVGVSLMVVAETVRDAPVVALPQAVHLAELLQLARIGYVRGIEAKLAELEGEVPALAPFCLQLRGWVRGFEMQKLTAYLDTLPELNS